VVDHDAPTCLISDRIGDVRSRLARSDWASYVVLDQVGIVHGRVEATALTNDLDPETIVESVMQPGPATVRPSEALVELVKRMSDHDVDTMIVTTSDGRFVGVLRRVDAERVLPADEGGAGG